MFLQLLVLAVGHGQLPNPLKSNTLSKCFIMIKAMIKVMIKVIIMIKVVTKVMEHKLKDAQH